jgi:hypothetical protein
VGGGVGTLHLTGKKKNRDLMVDGDDEDGEEEYDNAEERGGSEEEEEPLFGRGVVGELHRSNDEFEYNSEDGPKLDNLEIRWWRTTTRMRGRRRRRRRI